MKINIPVRKTLNDIKRAPKELLQDTSFRIKEGVSNYVGKFTKVQGVPPSFQKEYKKKQAADGESALDVIKRVMRSTGRK